MEGNVFTKLASQERDGGQRLEVDVEVSAACVDGAIDEFAGAVVRAHALDAEASNSDWDAVELALGAEEASEACRDFVLNRFSVEALRQLGVEAALAPGVHAEALVQRGENFAFSLSVVPRPQLSLTSCDPVEVERPSVCVEECDVDEQIAFTAEQYATYRRVDRTTVREGDFVLADASMLRNGRLEHALSGIGRRIEIAHGLVPDALLEAVVGRQVGETVNAAFRLPREANGCEEEVPADDDYEAELVIREIQGRCVPVIDDAWVAQMLPEFATLEGFRAVIRRDLEKQRAEVERRELVYRVRAAIAQRLVGTVPDEMYHDAKESLMAATTSTIEGGGSTLDDYCGDHGITADAFNVNVFMQASDYLRQNLALDLLAEARGIEETEDEVQRIKQGLPRGMGALPDEEFRKRGLRKALGQQVRREKALQWLLDTAVVGKTVGVF